MKTRKWDYLIPILGSGVFAFLSYMFYKKVISKRLTAKTVTDKSALTRQEAMIRAKVISNLKYTLFLQLKSDSVVNSKNSFEGSVLISFNLDVAEVKHEFFIDFQGKLANVLVNGVETKVTHVNDKIYIPKEVLRSYNQIQINYCNQYANESFGIRLWVDPEDSVT